MNFLKTICCMGIVVVLFFCACSCSESSDTDESEMSFLIEMRNVNDINKVTYLGTNDSNAIANERPQMKVLLQYDYWMGRHEVTCGEFNLRMEASFGRSLDCSNDSLPATEVSYYDAILYANELSKAAGFDTAYTYSAASFDGDKSCTNLEGLIFLPEVDAYRLPTEAEWTYVAAQNWSPANSWSADNSKGQLHGVCHGESKHRFCDMAGNAMEWVNDWLGLFRDTVVVNYGGADNGGTLDRRIVKGGSFRNPASAMHLHNRGDVYTITSAARANYIGFRLAYGSIPNVLWMNDYGEIKTNVITPVASSFLMRSLVGSYKAKLAFRNDLSGNLAYIDYGSGVPRVTEIQDDIEVYHPEISPDGMLVAFCTGLEGVSGKSQVYVRRLDAKGSNLVQLDAESAAIPRWRVLENGDTAIVYVSSAGNNEDETGFKSASTWQVLFSNGKFGTPEKLFDGAYHGGIGEDGKFSVTGARLLRARIPSGSDYVDTVWYGGDQACNASLSKDGSRRTLFLDFAGKTGKEFVGEPYGTHERMFIADSVGELMRAIPSPQGYSFDHTEWATGGSDIVVASLVDNNGVHRKIVAMNLSDDRIVEMVYGEELWHPSLWIGSAMPALNIEFDPDSAGIYFTDIDKDPLLSRKMNIFWIEADSLKVVAVGSSRMSMGFRATNITYGRAFNFAHIPSDLHTNYYLAKNYILNYCSQLDYLIVGLDVDMWETAPGTVIRKNTLSIPGYTYDANHDFWVDGDVADLKKVSKQIVDETYILKVMHNVMGWVNINEGFSWTNGGFNENPIIGNPNWDEYTDAHMNALKELDDLLNIAANRGVTVIGLVFPQSPYYKKTNVFGRYGLTRSTARKLLKEIGSLRELHPNFIFIDENKMGDHGYPDSLAYDYDHLNALGANRITAVLDSVMNSRK